jgi:peptidoglycan/xylan/chitin deacetylase (PgdA/CDA1 family)
MYHSVGRILDDWAWSNLTTPARVFEDHLDALSRAGYRSVSLDEWHDHATGTTRLAGKNVVLTFDDGYVDNWTYVAPLLERYGFRGTVLATVEFVQEDDSVRPTLRDVWAQRVAEDELAVRGFMSWAELRRGVESGILDVQSHAFTHTWYPVGDEVVDFHHPGDAHYWLDWNAFPESKPSYLLHPGASRVPYGVPVYRHEKSLACRRYVPDPAESEHCASWVARQGGERFFADPEWRERLRAELQRYRSAHPSAGRSETDAERARRLQHEIVESKRALEGRLDKKVDFLVWPGGGYDAEATRIARSHYKAVTLSGAARQRFRNRPGENPGSIVRRGVPAIDVGTRSHVAPGSYLVEFLDEFRGVPGARRRRQIRKLGLLAGARLGVWPR